MFAAGDQKPVLRSEEKVKAGAPTVPRVEAAKYEEVVVAAAEIVPVAVRLASERLPEKRAFPWTERGWEGVVVPIPTLPLARSVMVEVAVRVVPSAA